MNKTLFIAIIIFTSLVKFSYAANNNKNLYLKNISVSKNAGSRLIWFKFNGKPDNIIPKYILNNYSLELTFKNTSSVMGSKFMKFKNKLFRGIELVPLKNLNLNAIIFFNKGIKIDKKDIKWSYYKNYFIIKISHKFSSGLFKNIGVKPVSVVSSRKPLNINTSNNNIPNNNIPKNTPFSLNPGSKNSGNLNVGFEIVKTVVYLALVLGLIYIIYFLLLKFKGRVAEKKNLNNLKIISSLNLGNKKSILLIEVNKELFLVGVSHSNIQVIGHIKDLNRDNIDSSLSGNDKVNKVNVDDNSKTSFHTDGLSNESYGNFANVLKNQVDSKESLNLNPNIKFDYNKSDRSDNYKIKNISEARFKNKADNVFFDIEEKLKGLIENDGNIKKF